MTPTAQQREAKEKFKQPLPSLERERKATLTDIKIKNKTKQNFGNSLENSLAGIWRTMTSEVILGKSYLNEF